MSLAALPRLVLEELCRSAGTRTDAVITPRTAGACPTDAMNKTSEKNRKQVFAFANFPECRGGRTLKVLGSRWKSRPS